MDIYIYIYQVTRAPSSRFRSSSFHASAGPNPDVQFAEKMPLLKTSCSIKRIMPLTLTALSNLVTISLGIADIKTLTASDSPRPMPKALAMLVACDHSLEWFCQLCPISFLMFLVLTAWSMTHWLIDSCFSNQTNAIKSLWTGSLLILHLPAAKSQLGDESERHLDVFALSWRSFQLLALHSESTWSVVKICTSFSKKIVL